MIIAQNPTFQNESNIQNIVKNKSSNQINLINQQGNKYEMQDKRDNSQIKNLGNNINNFNLDNLNQNLKQFKELKGNTQEKRQTTEESKPNFQNFVRQDKEKELSKMEMIRKMEAKLNANNIDSSINVKLSNNKNINSGNDIKSKGSSLQKRIAKLR